MVRVLEALTDAALRRQLRKKVPTDEIPELDTIAYPMSLVKLFPEKYVTLGILTEFMIRPNGEANIQKLCKDLLDLDVPDKVIKVASTKAFLESVQATRQKIKSIIGDEPFYTNKEIAVDGCSIVGHPDLVTKHDIFEVKTTGRLKEGWTMFLMQAFSHAALYESAQRVHIVLPLQNHVWTYDLSQWRKRQLFKSVLMSFEEPNGEQQASGALFNQELCERFNIGTHVSAAGALGEVIDGLKHLSFPMQIFLTRTAQITKPIVCDPIAAMVRANNMTMFVHAPYLLNLATDAEYIVESAKKHMTYAVACGFKGVVFHVGKACKLDPSEALENMRALITAAMECATPDCPFLVETPAGQGTELLTDMHEFMEFVASFNDPRVGMCIDTCHVFATGVLPSMYIKTALCNPLWSPRLKLIHFNDSLTPQGSRVDRHEVPGLGHIPKDDLENSARAASEADIPMLRE